MNKKHSFLRPDQLAGLSGIYIQSIFDYPHKIFNIIKIYNDNNHNLKFPILNYSYPMNIFILKSFSDLFGSSSSSAHPQVSSPSVQPSVQSNSTEASISNNNTNTNTQQQVSPSTKKPLSNNYNNNKMKLSSSSSSEHHGNDSSTDTIMTVNLSEKAAKAYEFLKDEVISPAWA